MKDSDSYEYLRFDDLFKRMYGEPDSDSPKIVYYLQQKTIDETFPELVEDVEYVNFIEAKTIRNTNLWLSQRGSRIPLHFDTFDNLLAQVRGTKRVKLLTPQQTAYLYPGVDGAEFASKVDPERPDLSNYPLFRMAKLHSECLLHAGDILYIPAYWWHYVTTESDVSLSLNFWYHLVCGYARESFMIARDIWRIGLHYLEKLPTAQRELAVAEFRRLLDGVALS